MLSKRVVVIGGGTGSFQVLSGLRQHHPHLVLQSIVTTFDSGGDSGELRDAYGVLPPGDLRRCLVALSEESLTLRQMFSFRFNGDGPLDHPALAGLDLPPLGYPGRPAPLLTRELLFIGEGRSSYGGGSSRVPEGMLPTMVPGAGGRAFRAFDKTTGEVVWKTDLPSGTTGSPITYLHDGRQYIVVAVGRSEEEGGSAAQLVALGLP